MKIIRQSNEGYWPSFKKIWLIMKLNIILILFTVFHVSASVSAQNTRLDLKMKNASISQVFDEIERQSEVYFFYNKNQIDETKTISVDYRNKTIDEILSSVNGAQQSGIKVKGTVKNASGESLPGVSVVVKGTTNGSITDADGNYNLTNVPNEGTMVFSFVGMKTQEIVVAGKAVLNVVLEDETIGIEEVVAIGYGTVKKSDLTGAVGSVQGETISERQTTMLSQALQGTTSGVMVTRNNNAPGSTATIRIRGITTIGDSNPLIIVDGVPVDNINDINPNDVESMSVLKDAASASIYGSRAAAGVILITTKRAKSGDVSLTYNMEYGMEKPTALPEYVDVTRYMQMTNELRWNDNNNNANEYPLYAKDVIDNYTSLNAENPNKYPNTDWVGLMLNDYAPRQTHTLGITAGTKAIRTKASLAYDKTDGLFDGKSYERITARFNNDVTITKNLAASFDLFFKRSMSKNPQHDPMYNTLISPPVYAAKWADGRVAEGKTGANIWGMTFLGGYNNGWYNQIGGKMSLDYTPLEGLKSDDPTVLAGTLEGSTQTDLYETRNDNYRVTSQLLANYMKSFGSHNLNAMVGYENFYAFNENLGASRQKYELTNYPYLDLGPLDLRGNNGSAYENAYRSYFGRLMYNYQNKYFLQGNVRYDGSSRFAEDYRWGTFPSFSAGWIMTEENFMKDIPWLSFLKVRGSWGSLGNERIGNYPYQATIAFSNALFYQGSNVAAAQTAAQTQYAIQDISWETTQSIDFGIDANLFGNRLRFTGDYYEKTTKDMLLQLEIPDYIGFDNPDQNTGKMFTKGWEAELGWSDKIGEVGYSISGNISDFQSEMGDLGGTEFIGDQIKKKGSEFNEWYGYLSDGLFQTADDLAASAKLGSNQKVGDVKYKDLSGPDGMPDGKISPEYDRVLLGGSLPRYMYGANLKVDYKNFDFSIVFQGIGHQNRRLSGIMITPLIANWGHMPKIIDGTSWYAMSDYWLMNGGYFRLKNITLGYNLPTSLTQKINLQRVRIYGSASDIFTIDNFPKGWDPEVAESGYPITSSYIFGLSVTF